MRKILQDYLVFILAFILYIPFLFLGYGTDNDTYNVLWAGENFAGGLDYVPSRRPGFLVFETAVFFLNRLGGSFFTNLGVMVMSLVVLYGFMRLCRAYHIPHEKLLATILVIHPYYWVNSTCTMDYLFALGFVFLGMVQILRGKYFTAGIALALGIGSRLTAALAASGFLVWFFILEPGARKKLLQTGFVTVVCTVLFYLPPASFMEWTSQLFSPTVGGSEFWTPYLRLGRFLYKNLYFWSPLAAGVLVWAVVESFRSRKRFLNPVYRGLPILAGGIILAYEIFYLGIPTEPAYLLPTVPFWLILAGTAFKNRRWLLWALLVLVFTSNFVTINIARPDVINQATGAVYGLWIEPGHLVQDVEIRLQYMQCDYWPCDWEK